MLQWKRGEMHFKYVRSTTKGKIKSNAANKIQNLVSDFNIQHNHYIERDKTVLYLRIHVCI